ncbi:YbhB/YbcL family Raf kinase inhibitor-like protein [Patescibacteria group bacterium]|nr:YbhB/YbcL family Raf kinase inhibitor-like protein [Patescibacteria group bacterium]
MVKNNWLIGIKLIAIFAIGGFIYFFPKQTVAPLSQNKFLKIKTNVGPDLKTIRLNQNLSKMKITSPNFENNNFIPSKYTCDGQDINPELEIKSVLADAKSLVLIVDDPDAPGGDWVHWLVWNIDPKTALIKEKSVPIGAVVGLNSFGKNSYGGPCPPSGAHHYHFKIYAIDTTLNIASSSRKINLEESMAGHIIGQGEIIGLYARKK